MTSIVRWPLHPHPGEGEALSSWLDRIADAYGMEGEELLVHHLGAVSHEMGSQIAEDLDLDPPTGVLTALKKRTGVPLVRLRRMTVAGWVPWLLDPLEAEPAPGMAFDTYVRQDSVLLGPGEAPHRQVPGWRAWVPADPARAPMRRACPVCIANASPAARQFTLVSQLPVTLSCPDHGCRLQEAMGARGTFFAWAAADTHPIAVQDAISVMDRRTEEAMRISIVALPGRDVHTGVWFRLLRTLIEELSTPLSKLRRGSQRAVCLTWQVTGHPLRIGMGAWRPYEALLWPRQQAFLEAAATAMHLIETGEVPTAGGLGPLLRPTPHQPVGDGTAPVNEPVTRWKQTMDALNDAIAAARENPAEAQQLLAVLTAWKATPATVQRARQDLIAAGVPEEYIPEVPPSGSHL